MRGSANLDILKSPNPTYATQSELSVVPIFAHRMTGIAWYKDNNHHHTNATSRSETKVLLVVIPLIQVPARNAFRAVFVCFSKRRFSCLPQSDFIDSSKRYNPNISSPAPARNFRRSGNEKAI